MLHRIKNLIFALFSSPVLLEPLVKVFGRIAFTGRGSNRCMKSGFLPLPVDFHSPIPKINDLEERNIWDIRNELTGIDFRPEAQLKLLTRIGDSYSDECKWDLLPTDNPSEFYLENPSFSYGCAASTHCMIRHYKPDTVIEIGSGMSSRIIFNALAMNKDQKADSGKHIVVDPYPADNIRDGSIGISQLVESRVELLAPAFFDQLKANDILFIDSGHCVRIGGDVNYLFLDILPRLDWGVIVHIHDISLPYDYPKVYATSETFRQFWTEQYLLQGFLCFNNEFEVLLAMNYLMTDHAEAFKKSFPNYDPIGHPVKSGSFWMRHKQRIQDKCNSKCVS